MEKKVQKRLAGNHLATAREYAFLAWEKHGTAMPPKAYKACQKAIEAIMEAEIQVLRWDTEE